MAKNRSDEEERQRRRERRRGGMGGGPSAGGEGGGGPASEYDADEVERMLAKSQETGEYINPSHFSNRRAWQEYYSRLDNSIKRGNKERSGRNRASDEAYARRGGNFEDLGIRDVKEQGRARYRRLGMHNLDRSFSYDWDNGVKYNIATSDDNEYMKPIPLTPDDYREHEEILKYGDSPEGYFRRLQDAQRSQMNTWAAQNEVKGGVLRRDAHGLYMEGNNGERIDFDQYGNLIDANSGQIIGGQYGDKSDLLSQASGYKSPWSLPVAAPGAPPPVGITPPPNGGINPVGTTGGGIGGTGLGGGPSTLITSSPTSTGMGAPPALHAPATSAPSASVPGMPTSSFVRPGSVQVGGIPSAPGGMTGNAWNRTNAYPGARPQPGPRPGGGMWYRKPGAGMGRAQPTGSFGY